MNIQEILEKLASQPESVSFDEVITAVDMHYDFYPTVFYNGELKNAADQNNGSCKIFSFAQLHGLNETQTLNCFGDYYRQDVLSDADGDNHQNIRNFIKMGWSGVRFEGQALIAKSASD